MSLNCKPTVVGAVFAAACAPLVYDLLQPIDFHNYKKPWIPMALFLGTISVFFVCVVAFRRFARLCARSPDHLPNTIRDAQVSCVLCAIVWVLGLIAFIFDR